MLGFGKKKKEKDELDTEPKIRKRAKALERSLKSGAVEATTDFPLLFDGAKEIMMQGFNLSMYMRTVDSNLRFYTNNIVKIMNRRSELKDQSYTPEVKGELKTLDLRLSEELRKLDVTVANYFKLSKEYNQYSNEPTLIIDHKPSVFEEFVNLEGRVEQSKEQFRQEIPVLDQAYLMDVFSEYNLNNLKNFFKTESPEYLQA